VDARLGFDFVAAFDTLCRTRTADRACYFYETRDLG